MTIYNRKLCKSILTNKKKASYDAKHNLNKDKFNSMCCDALLKNISGKTYKENQALILDGIHMRSTNACTKIGIKKKNITSIERNRLLYNNHLKNGINSIYGDAWKTMANLNYYKPYHLLILLNKNKFQ